ncbi:odorant receptor 58 [Nasonia vitripennis]|uniref:Odorant receptor n=1 Tax=Nasonia vitripennis TaxID=7425 RepID=A0A7M6UWA8_NASVI|nr:odorant receptor 58 [Nasonia vitripennis]
MTIQSVLRRKVDVLLKAIALNKMCVSPKMILLVIKFAAMYLAIWPLDSSGKHWNTAFDCLWWFYVVNNVLVIIPTLLAFYSSRRDIIAAMFSWLEILALLEALIILANFRYYRSRMQPILKEAVDYIGSANSRRQLCLEKRASIITTTFGVIVALYIAGIIIYIYRPAVTEWDGMLTTAYYPASMRSPFADVFIYITQLTALLHNGVLIVSDAFTVLLLYVCTVRLEVLQKNILRVADYDELKLWIREHERVLRLVTDTNMVVRINISKTVISFVGYSVGAGLQIISPTVTIVSFQRFALVIAMNAMRLFFSATFADDLVNSSNSLINTIYSTIWYKDNRDMKIGKIIIMLRCQKLLRISVGGIMPVLGKPYLTKILYTSVSYFMTFRAITGN